MPSNNAQEPIVKRSEADEGDLYFVKSPFYWQNSNPSSLAKTWHGFLRIVGHENYVEAAENQENKTEFEAEIIRTNAVIEDFRKFIRDGQKFGTINVTNADAEYSHFEMLKRMYGSVVYVVFEEREFPLPDPRKKHERHVSFISEYDLCVLNQRAYHSDESYYHAITDKIIPSIITSSGQLKQQNECKETSFERTRKKMYRNGFSLGSGTNESYAPLRAPSEDEYFSNQKREQLDSQDLMNLLWTVICDASCENDASSNNKRTLYQDLVYELYRANIIGFGWMPCLLAKRELNELDRCVLYLYEKSNIHNDLHKAAHSVEINDEDKPYAPPGTHQILVFKNKTYDTFQPIERYPLDKVVKISRAELGQYRITDVNGQELLTDYIDLVDDVPQVDIKMSPEVPGRYVVTGRYADGRCIKHEMDESEWKEHSYEIDKYIPGSLQAIKEYNLKQALDNGELTAIPNSYAIPLKWDDTVYWVKDTLDPNKIKVRDYVLSEYEGSLIYQQLPPIRYISVPEYTYGSNGTYNDLKEANNK